MAKLSIDGPNLLRLDYNYRIIEWVAIIIQVGSLLCGVYMLVGPLVGGLVNKFGCRWVNKLQITH